MSMYEKFEKLLVDNNVTPYRVHKETGISTATLSDWKNGKSEPKRDKIQKVCDFFKVPISYFYTENNSSLPLENECDSCIKDSQVPTNEQDIKIYVDKIMEKLEEIKDESLYYGGVKIQVNDSNRQLFKDALSIAVRSLGIDDTQNQ